jgi:hypothetical protein
VRGLAVASTVLAAVPGCELVFPLDPTDIPADAAIDDATPAVDAGPCPPFPIGTWGGVPTGLVGTSPTLTSTGLRMIFAVDLDPGDNDQDLHDATSDGSTWTDAGQILASTARHDSPALDPLDDATMLFSEGASGRVLRAAWDGATWTEGELVIPGSGNDVQNGTLTDVIGGKRHIVVARRAVGEPASAIDLFEYLGDGNEFTERVPSTTAAVNTPVVADLDPHLSPDGCWLLFATDRAGELDLQVADRLHPDAPFANPRPIDLEDRASFAETDPWLSRDGTRLYFTRRVGMQNEIWVATPR